MTKPHDTALATLVGEYVELQSRGKSLVGFCPFHEEATPSFHVNTERQLYHCFRCCDSGDALRFLQKVKGISLEMATQELAARVKRKGDLCAV